MYLLLITLFELGQFLRIVLWVFIPLFVIILLITTYIHYRRKRQAPAAALETGELLLSVESIPADMEEPDEDNLYKGLLWMKQKFEEYREQSDQRVSALKEELAQAKEKIADLTGKLDSLLGSMPEAASGGSGELVKE
ncbi:MAG: hypothetical protein J0H74_04380 [Chitinophagaceae bacterium]|nr:hypothetical protein [Chitinophagaceae bacterium]